MKKFQLAVISLALTANIASGMTCPKSKDIIVNHGYATAPANWFPVNSNNLNRLHGKLAFAGSVHAYDPKTGDNAIGCMYYNPYDPNINITIIAGFQAKPNNRSNWIQTDKNINVCRPSKPDSHSDCKFDRL